MPKDFSGAGKGGGRARASPSLGEIPSSPGPAPHHVVGDNISLRDATEGGFELAGMPSTPPGPLFTGPPMLPGRWMAPLLAVGAVVLGIGVGVGIAIGVGL